MSNDIDLKKTVKEAIQKEDYAVISRIVDALRFKFGANYFDCRDYFLKNHGVSHEDFENIMYFCDAQGY